MILVCAATRTEAGACRAGIRAAGAGGYEVLTTGVGPARAAAALRRRLGGGARPALVVSAGFAGALTDGLPPLAWVTASALFALEGGAAVPVPLPPGLLRRAAGAVACDVLTAGAVAGAAAGLGPRAAADMESAALGAAAAGAGIPFAVLRLVTDTPARPLAPLGRLFADALAAPDLAARVRGGARVARELALAPLRSADFVRESLGWTAALRDGWRARAAGGILAS